jgi:hypothetical protein
MFIDYFLIALSQSTTMVLYFFQILFVSVFLSMLASLIFIFPQAYRCRILIIDFYFYHCRILIIDFYFYRCRILIIDFYFFVYLPCLIFILIDPTADPIQPDFNIDSRKESSYFTVFLSNPFFIN